MNAADQDPVVWLARHKESQTVELVSFQGSGAVVVQVTAIFVQFNVSEPQLVCTETQLWPSWLCLSPFPVPPS